MYIYIYIYAVCKRAQYYCRAFISISINGSRINYKCIIATNSFMCVTIIFRLYNYYIYIYIYIIYVIYIYRIKTPRFPYITMGFVEFQMTGLSHIYLIAISMYL